MPKPSIHVLWLVLAALASCQSDRWSAADPGNANQLRCCTGRVVSIHEASDGGRELRLTPGPKDVGMLASGQAELICTVPADKMPIFATILDLVSEGSDCEVCGWFVRNDATGEHHLRPVTSIDPHVEASSTSGK